MTADALATQLRQITADLEGYIDRRAQEVAAPVIAAAQADAEERVQEMTQKVRRAHDLEQELRRQLAAMERQRDTAWDVAGVLAGRLQHHAHCEDHPGWPDPDADCPFCRDRSAYLRWEVHPAARRRARMTAERGRG